MSSAAAPSEIWLDTAAVSRPPSSSGFSVAIFSSEVSRRGPSSTANSPNGDDLAVEALLVDGADGAAGGSRGRRPPSSCARDVPLLGDHLGAAGTATRPGRRSAPASPCAPAKGCSKPNGCGHRHRRRRWGSRSCSARRRRRPGPACRSSRPAPRSAPPAATSRTGGRPSCRAPLRAGPPTSQQVRAMSPACGPMVSRQPKTTSSTARGSMPARAIERLEHVRAEVGRVDLGERARRACPRACERRR